MGEWLRTGRPDDAFCRDALDVRERRCGGIGTKSMAVVKRWIRTCGSLEAELVFVAIVLLAWHAIRIPLEGGVSQAMAHAEDVLALERALSLDVEASLIANAAEQGVADALAWLYTNIHLPVLFGSMAAFRLLAPDRYPRLRTTFVVSFLPAVLVIGLYPLAPPRWLPELGMGPTPTQAELASTNGALFHNETAAAASQHFGFAVFVAAASIWLFPRSRLAWLTLVYPALVFVVVVGTGNHYIVDCVIGSLTFVLAASAAWLLHRGHEHAQAPMQASDAIGIAIGYGLIVWGFVSLDLTAPPTWNNLFPEALVLAAGVAAVLLPRLGTRTPVAERG